MSGGSLNMIWNSTFSVSSKFLCSLFNSLYVYSFTPCYMYLAIYYCYAYIRTWYIYFCYVNRSLIMRTEVAKMSRLVDFYYSCLLLIEHINSILASLSPPTVGFCWTIIHGSCPRLQKNHYIRSWYFLWNLQYVTLLVYLIIYSVDNLTHLCFIVCHELLIYCCRWKWCSPWNCA